MTHHWQVWNLAEPRPIWRREQKPGSKFHSAVFTTEPPVMYFGGEGADIRRVDLRTGKDLPSWVGHEEIVVALALSPDERTLASGGSDKQVKFWHVATGREVASRKLEQEVLWLEFSPDNERLAVLEANQHLRLIHAPRAASRRDARE
jgi:WD40 repeat protein